MVWLASPPVEASEGRLHLISCAAYPRCQEPSEQECVQRMFQSALNLVIGHSAAFDQVESSGPPSSRKIRVLTHAMGSFLGHTRPEVFAEGLAAGLHSFLADFGLH